MADRTTRRRAAILLAVMLAGLLGLSLRLGYVQAVRADEYTDFARQQRLRTVVLPAMRGAIYDRHGQELAMSVAARTVYANPRQVSDPEGTGRVLAPLVGQDVREVVDKLRQDRGFVYLARRLDVDAAERIERLGLTGIGILDESRRSYPGGALAANVLGFVGGDGQGLSGLESTHEKLLGGRPGSRVLEQDPLGRRIPQGVFVEKPPSPGSDVLLTLDRDIQYAAEKALGKAVQDTGAKGGSVIVMDPRSGEILAMANAPTFDPGDLEDIKPAERRNRAVTDVYEPGSVGKIVTASAALEEGLVDEATPFGVGSTIRIADRVYHEAKAHAPANMRFDEIIAQSSNVGTIKVAQKVGPEKMAEYMSRFGYGRSTQLGFPGESSGIMPPREKWSRASMPTMSMGQGVSATAVQMTRMFATIANDGVSVEPKLVAGWVDPKGRPHYAPQRGGGRVVSSTTAATVRRILAKAVEDGTGTRAQIPGYDVAGKTGTAQKAVRGGYRGFMASFIGFLPASQPRVVVSVVLDEPAPYYGGIVSAPVFKEVAEAAVRIMRIPPTEDPADVPRPKVKPGVAEAEGPGTAASRAAAATAKKPVVAKSKPSRISRPSATPRRPVATPRRGAATPAPQRRGAPGAMLR
ncbi:MAG TPA: penicillin-binding transpeptidase domain-containing protein [Actinomycetota bacterium]|nr:penicillin-binding transpeptidase domain-containing protein [Actinomycetota bacterium]